MKNSLALLLSALVLTATVYTPPSNAEDKVGIVEYDDATPSIYVFRVNEDGSLEKLQVGGYLDFTSDSPTDPTDPPKSDLTEKTEEMVRAIGDPEKARTLALAYSVIILSSDEFSGVSEIGRVAKEAADEAIEGDEDWAEFRQFLQDELVRMAQRGKLQSVEDYVSFLSQVREGLLASTDGAKMKAITFEEIMEIIRDVLSLFEDEITLEKVIELALKIIDLFGDIIGFDKQGLSTSN